MEDEVFPLSLLYRSLELVVLSFKASIKKTFRGSVSNIL